ncbi:hypothetical protein R6Q59_015108 [Mikania micrantha]|uniref:Aminotransferase class I/classII large domain-containing protein n=1 Tax=Mikania micrantha TaxID=192012 RepID=A0A5N6PHD9_9ASTR|nr:hypothetical protein E3N88_07750 [Mikania micrantha]
MLSTCNSHGQDSSYFLGCEEYEKNPYHRINNPTGMIQMGIAENQLSFNLGFMTTRIQQVSVLKVALVSKKLHSFKIIMALADFMSEIRENKMSFNPNNLVLTAGATSANETLMFCLADHGDVILKPFELEQ